MRHYCTYFDARFAPRGLALHRSLRRHERDFVLHALCLDHAALAAVRSRNDPTLRPLALADLEAADPALPAARADRSTIEYYFTLTPALLRHIMAGTPAGTLVTYLDADLWFLASPQAAFDELGDGSVLIVPHRLPPALRHLEVHGLYNVGFNVFRHDDPGRACLEWWRQRCLEWCYDRVEPARYADQKYLDSWPQRFPGVVVSRHPGVNLAPWNLGGHRLSQGGAGLLVDGQPLVVFHFHRLRYLRRWLVDPGLARYGVPLTPLLRRALYGPYLRELAACRGALGAEATGNLRLGDAAGGRGLLRAMLYQHTLLRLGPITAEMHAEPLARPLLRLRERWASRRAA